MPSEQIVCVTCTAPVNIAVIKYWGKRDEKLILPINSSLSGTLDQQHLRAKTTVAACASFKEDRMWLNGEEQSLASPRLQNVLKEIRRRSRKRKSGSEEDLDMLGWHVHICSENNFPTAAGLASSAAGFACLVFSLAKLFKLDGNISEIARQGSGSACRSVYGGFVDWIVGECEDGSDSLAHQVVPESHWPEMRVLILVVSACKKHTGSTQGMQSSVRTSQLLKHRADKIVPHVMDAMVQSIKDRDFQTFADITMKVSNIRKLLLVRQKYMSIFNGQDSNQFHAVCLDTYPPISYMTDISHQIVRIVHTVNDYYKMNKVAYTFDAGPNACLYLLEENVPLVLGLVKHFFPQKPDNGEEYVRGLQSETLEPPQDLVNAIPFAQNKPGSLQYIISTKIGPGPQVLNDSKESLLNEQGMPKFTSNIIPTKS